MRLVLDARTASFGALIDYAGVFPPASLATEDAVREYRSHRESPDAWAIGRFLVRASQLESLGAVVTSSFRRGDHPWSVGVVFDLGVGASATLAQAFHYEMSPAMEVTSAEVRYPERHDEVRAILEAVATIDRDVATFIEVDTHRPLREQIETIDRELRESGQTGGAKLRCGGVTADHFPSVDTVVDFLWEASLAGLPFKATAGLHQPVRHRDEELDVMRHGFLNLLAGSAACDEGEDRTTVQAIVAEEDPEAFEVNATALRWRDVMLPGSAVRRSRHDGFTAYGSCDLDEPLSALRALGFLGDGT